MGVKQSIGTGNFNAAGTWDAGVPGTGDVAWINAGHVVTLTAGPQVLGIVLNGGTLRMYFDITIDDAAGAGILIKNVNSGGIEHNGVANAWRIFKSVHTGPNIVYPWTISVEAVTGTDLRNLDFSVINFEGNLFYLGNSTFSIAFNTPSLKDYLVCDNVNPPMRESALIEKPIRGRTSGRLYTGYYSAASMQISGSCKFTSALPQYIDYLQRTGMRLSFFSRYWHLPKCRIDGKPIFTSVKGEYLSWSLVLREDV